MNPLITMGTFFGKLATFPRTFLYILCQITGATVAGFVMRAAAGKLQVIPGCWIDTAIVTAGEALALETMTCITLIFFAYGIGLDPRQRVVFGPALGPLLIGLALGLCTFATGALKPGYTGASMNPARCFGLMAAEGRWNLHWVHWVGPIIATALNGVLYKVIPPSKRRKIP
jgi:glycerol uptake facilitator-like aquaporin